MPTHGMIDQGRHWRERSLAPPLVGLNSWSLWFAARALSWQATAHCTVQNEVWDTHPKCRCLRKMNLKWEDWEVSSQNWRKPHAEREVRTPKENKMLPVPCKVRQVQTLKYCKYVENRMWAPRCFNYIPWRENRVSSRMLHNAAQTRESERSEFSHAANSIQKWEPEPGKEKTWESISI